MNQSTVCKSLVFCALLVCGAFIWEPSHAQSVLPPNLQKIREYRRANETRLTREFLRFLALPNVAYDSAAMRANAAALMEMMRRRGIGGVRLLDAAAPSAPPAVYGEVLTPGAKRTVVFYAHYDGQPVNPAEWTTGGKPFEPLLRSDRLDRKSEVIPFPTDSASAAAPPLQPEWRAYGRSASDDKGGVMAILAGYEALAASRQKPSANIKFFFEGEEEAGSPHLGEILERHKNLLKSDLWIICDGPVHQSGRKVIYFGVRGDVNVDLTVYGPKRPLHSGHYGNWIPNPAMKLAQLLASMKDSAGRVTIDGFYDDVKPLSAKEREALKALPKLDDEIRRDLGVARADGAGSSLAELLALPSLNVNGLRSANVGAMAANVIPTVAHAVLDLRLVLGNDYERQTQKVANHIRKQGYLVLDRDPSDAERLQYPNIAKMVARPGAYNAQRTSMDIPSARAVAEALQSASAEPIVLIPSTGGSLPLYLFERHLNALTFSVPIANYDNNQHAENENLRLQNLWDGVEMMAALMMLRE